MKLPLQVCHMITQPYQFQIFAIDAAMKDCVLKRIQFLNVLELSQCEVCNCNCFAPWEFGLHKLFIIAFEDLCVDCVHAFAFNQARFECLSFFLGVAINEFRFCSWGVVGLTSVSAALGATPKVGLSTSESRFSSSLQRQTLQ